MKFFIDTANVEDIKRANDMGVICGVTTNPSLIAKEGRDFKEVIKEITSIVDGPISGEVKATTVRPMYLRFLADWMTSINQASNWYVRSQRFLLSMVMRQKLLRHL